MDMKECIGFLENQKRYDIPPPNCFNKKIDEIIKQLQEIEKKWSGLLKEMT